jgi:uncharacterized protein YabE (DUF348 family)
MRPSIGRAAIIIALGVATIAYGTFEKRVTLHVDGVPVSVRTFGGTVSSVLDRAGVPVGAGDIIQPSPSTAVGDGTVIEVRRAKWVTLMLDGKARKIVVTGVTVQDVLDDLALRSSVIDEVSPSRATRLSPGMMIVYERAKRLRIVADGRVRRVVTNADTIRDVIAELGIKLGRRDVVRPALRRAPDQGMKIRVLRVGIRKHVRTVTVGYGTVLRRSKALEYGERRVIRQGRPGLKRVLERVRYVDGRPVARTVLRSKMLRRPLDRIIKVGAGPECRCRKGTEVGDATWYAQADGMTAAHKTLPFGTIVRVENLENGRWVSVRIADRGPYGAGRIIDLSDEAFARIAPLSEGVVRVRIRW